MSTSVLKSLPGKLDIKRHSPIDALKQVMYMLKKLTATSERISFLPGRAHGCLVKLQQTFFSCNKICFEFVYY